MPLISIESDNNITSGHENKIQFINGSVVSTSKQHI